MAVIINASTSTGLVQSADTSGIIQFQSNGSTKATINSSGFSYPGGVLQVISVTKTDTFSTTSAGTFVDVTGLSVSITPKSASNKILIFCTIPCSHPASAIARFNIVRGSTNICQPASVQNLSSSKTAYYLSGDLGAASDIHFLDSPATTSATTYKIQCCSNGGTMFVGQRNSGDMAMPSTITVMEIAA
jgi:hypothetical protein